MIRCSQGKKHRRINCELHIAKRSWDNTKKQVRKGHPLSEAINKALMHKTMQIQECYLTLMREDEEVVLLEDVINLFQKPKSCKFL